MDVLHTDVLIVGGGLSSWMAAHTLLARKSCRVLMLSDGQGASPWVHGFNVPLHADDSIACFYQDTRRSGYKQNDPRLARALCQDSTSIFEEMLSLGAVFNRGADGGYQLLRPLGASHPRVASIGNETGPAIMEKLKERVCAHPGFSQLEHARALRLMVRDGRIQGALFWDQERRAFSAVSAGCVLLACGGFGRIYPFSTNLPDGGGDGVAMAYYAGADLVDMEFIQFEPSAAVYPNGVRGKGMITTLFYEGAVLKNALGERFMLKYSEKGERVDKDVLARCIAREILEGRGTAHGGVWFDATKVPAERLEKDYPLYVQRYRRHGIELSQTPVELAPAPHTTLGGVVIDTGCRTTVPGLMAAGEVTGGLHGANRIGGNAGLETLVFGRRAGNTLAETAFVPGAEEEALIPWAQEIIRHGTEDTAAQLSEIRTGMQEALQHGAYVLRSGKALEEALQSASLLQHRLSSLPPSPADQAYARLRLENDLTAARLTILSALERRESVGCHVRDDFPGREKSRYRIHAQLKDQLLLISREDWAKQSEEDE